MQILNGCLIVDLPLLIIMVCRSNAAAAPSNAAVTIRSVDGERSAVLPHAANLTSAETLKPRVKKSPKKIFDDDQDNCFN